MLDLLHSCRVVASVIFVFGSCCLSVIFLNVSGCWGCLGSCWLNICIYKKFYLCVEFAAVLALCLHFTCDDEDQAGTNCGASSQPELFPHSAYVEIFVTFATKVPYLTFCNKM